jgi:hypothetical protein
MTYFLVLCIGYNNAGVYAQFHQKFDWRAIRGGIGTAFGWLNTQFSESSEVVVSVPRGEPGRDGGSDIMASVPPPYTVSPRYFMFV